MIEGVSRRAVVRHEDERGSLTEVLRSDWPEFRRFGQAMVTVNRTGIVRAWHWHERQTDAIVVVAGVARVALYDARPGSPTHGALDEYVLSSRDLAVLFVPPGVWHGYKTTSAEAAIILNFPDQLYDAVHPDEGRAPLDAPGIPYDWTKS